MLSVNNAEQAVEKPKNFQFESVLWGRCKAEFYTQKSYIRSSVSGKWCLVIGSQRQRHWSTIRRLAALVEAGKSKEELLAEREAPEAPDDE